MTEPSLWVTVAMDFDREAVIGHAAGIQTILYLTVKRSIG